MIIHFYEGFVHLKKNATAIRGNRSVRAKEEMKMAYNSKTVERGGVIQSQ